MLFHRNAMTIRALVGLSCLVAFWAGPVWADSTRALYATQIEVDSQSLAERDQALSKTLQQVLIKVSGHPELAVDAKKQAVLQQALDNASLYLDEYSYTAKPGASARGELPFVLHVRFDSRQIDDLLGQLDLPIWHGDRPLTVIWLAELKDGEKVLVGSEADSSLSTHLEQYAAARGMPVLLPLLDLQDLNQVTPEDVWAPFPWVIKKASARYQGQAILLGKLAHAAGAAEQAGEWQSQWTLLLKGTKQTWHINAPTINAVLQQSLDRLTQALSERFAVRAKDDKVSRLSLAVAGVQGINGYTKVAAYLENLTPVQQLKLQSIGNDRVVFDLAVIGGRDRLMRAIAIDNLLSPLSNTVPSVTQLDYQLVA